jgi:hypothetical protein
MIEARSGVMNCKCRHPGCERLFDSKVGRAVHERLVHGVSYSARKTEFVCPYCQRKTYFDTELGLQKHLEECHMIPSKSLDWIAKRTFENLVYIYNDELFKIQSDRMVGGFLDEREKRKLLREGVLIIEEYGRMGKPTIYRLSEEALEILREQETYEEQ